MRYIRKNWDWDKKDWWAATILSFFALFIGGFLGGLLMSGIWQVTLPIISIALVICIGWALERVVDNDML